MVMTLKSRYGEDFKSGGEKSRITETMNSAP